MDPCGTPAVLLSCSSFLFLSNNLRSDSGNLSHNFTSTQTHPHCNASSLLNYQEPRWRSFITNSLSNTSPVNRYVNGTLSESFQPQSADAALFCCGRTTSCITDAAAGTTFQMSVNRLFHLICVCIRQIHPENPTHRCVRWASADSSALDGRIVSPHDKHELRFYQMFWVSLWEATGWSKTRSVQHKMNTGGDEASEMEHPYTTQGSGWRWGGRQDKSCRKQVRISKGLTAHRPSTNL